MNRITSSSKRSHSRRSNSKRRYQLRSTGSSFGSHNTPQKYSKREQYETPKLRHFDLEPKKLSNDYININTNDQFDSKYLEPNNFAERPSRELETHVSSNHNRDRSRIASARFESSLEILERIISDLNSKEPNDAYA